MTAGSGQYLAGLAAVLPRVGAEHEFILAVPAGRRVGELPAGWHAVGVPVALARLGANVAKVWFEQVSFPAACRRLNADVAFVPYWGSPWSCPCPVVVTVHDLIPLLLPAYRGELLQRLYTGLVSATARRAAAVVTDSEASRRDIVRHLRLPEGRVRAVHLAVGDCAAGAQGEADMRARLNLPAGRFLLYIGGFDARKNVRRTLEGYAQMVRRCESKAIAAPALVIAGKLPSADSAFAPDPRPVVKALGLSERVHFVGWVDEADKAALYYLAAGVLFVSEYEGFGLPVLEAMACDRSADVELSSESVGVV